MAPGPGPSLAHQLCSALHWSAALCSGEPAPMFQRSQGDAVCRLRWRGKSALSEPEGSRLNRQTSLPQSLTRPSHAKEDFKSSVQLVQKAQSGLVRLEPLWPELCSFDQMGPTEVPLVETGFQKLLFGGWLRGRNTVEAGSSA